MTIPPLAAPRWLAARGMPRELLQDAMDPWTWIPRMRIQDKTNQIRPIRELNPTQQQVLGALLQHEQVCVLKSRQVYASTIVVAFFAWLGWLRDGGYSTLCVTDAQRTTTAMNGMYRRYQAEMPSELRRPFRRDSRGTGELELDNGSRFNQIMAGGRGGGRGHTFQGLHMTEAGTYPKKSASLADTANVDETAYTAARAARAEVDKEPWARTVVESTAEGPGNWFHRTVLRALREPDWGFVFVPWYRHEEYRRSPPRGFVRTAEEERQAQLYGLDDAQLYWRRYKKEIDGYDDRRFAHNYPSSPAEPFLTFGGTWFDAQLLASRGEILMPQLEASKRELFIFEEFDPRRRYIMGVDTSGGVGGDYAVGQVLRDDRRQVARWSSNTTSPTGQADVLAKLGERYGRCPIAVEINKDGQAVYNRLRNDLFYPRLETDAQEKPYRMTKQFKRLIYGEGRDAVDQQALIVNDPRTCSELGTIREMSDGDIRGEGENHDDHSDALMLANFAGRHLFGRQVSNEDHVDRARAAREDAIRRHRGLR